jgi:hypothetical protein
VQLLDTDGIRNSQPPVEYPLDSRADLPPTVKLVRPLRDLTVTPAAKLTVAFEARDDFGVRVVWLCYRIQQEGHSSSGGDSFAASGKVKRVERLIDPGEPDRKHLKKTFPLDVAALEAKVGEQIVFWLEADDDCASNDSALGKPGKEGAESGGPGTDAAQKNFPRSQDIKLSVISREEKAAELQAEIERLYGQLRGQKENQEELNRKLLQLLEEVGKLKN